MSPEDSPPVYCEVALPKPLLRTFTYRLPPELGGAARPGARVLVPFGRRKLIGCIDTLARRTERADVRPVLDLLDDRPLLPEPLLGLCRWVADYYAAPLGLVLRAALPPGLLTESSYRVRRTEVAAPLELSASERAVLERLAGAERGLRATTLRDELRLSTVWPVLHRLRAAGLVEIDERPPDTEPPVLTRQVIRLVGRLPTLSARQEAFGRAPRQREAYEMLEGIGGEAAVAHMERRLGCSRSVLHGLVGKGLAEIAEQTVRRDPLADLEAEAPARPTPTAAQQAAIRELRDRAGRDDPGIVLLRGVTGSGKTLVYLELLEEVVGRRGRGAIVLVPEISLTPQTLARFRARFGDRVAVLHSGLSPGERHDEWRALRDGRKRIAIGARSAVFAPVGDLGAVILDEEHESSYKQSDTPRYHARAVAAVRARLEGCLCVLGSATPSLESWENARSGLYGLLELPERVTGHPLPKVELVDLRAEREGQPTPTVFSEPLRAALADRLARGEQSILLLNRRGYATHVQCAACGKVWGCGRCNVSLTFHRRRRRVVCHHCGFEAAPPAVCDECGAPDPSYSGLGTEQVERRLGELFPQARIARMDLDTTGTKWAHHEILERVRQGEVDVLLGTQMIAKGLDFPNVTLVGVVNADVGLNLPDFRASERTFQLLSQVAGRAGRGSRPGEVLVQTVRPAHFALRAAAAHDYAGFAERELADRAEPGYPPHRRLANLVVSGDDEERVAEVAEQLAEWTRALLAARGPEGLEVVGPAPCPIDRVRGRWRWHFLLKGDEAGGLGSVLRYLAEKRGRPSAATRLEIDRDPETLL